MCCTLAAVWHEFWHWCELQHRNVCMYVMYTLTGELSQGRMEVWAGAEARQGGWHPGCPQPPSAHRVHKPAPTALKPSRRADSAQSQTLPLALPLGLICHLPQILPGAG